MPSNFPIFVKYCTNKFTPLSFILRSFCRPPGKSYQQTTYAAEKRMRSVSPRMEKNVSMSEHGK